MQRILKLYRMTTTFPSAGQVLVTRRRPQQKNAPGDQFGDVHHLCRLTSTVFSSPRVLHLLIRLHEENKHALLQMTKRLMMFNSDHINFSLVTRRPQQPLSTGRLFTIFLFNPARLTWSSSEIRPTKMEMDSTDRNRLV